MRAIICGGGTAGHITPGISIAEAILERREDAEILFIGREGGDENRIILHNGFPLETIEISGFRRKINTESIKTVKKLLSALKRSREIIAHFAPDIVIGTGGYVSFPVIKSAQRLAIPTIIHESNVCPGLSARLLASKCDRVLLNFPGSEEYFKKRDNLRVVGNPLRNSLLNETREGARRRLGIQKNDYFILSFGGSGGSDVINRNIIKLMEIYSSKCGRIKHVHATGKKYYEKIASAHRNLTSLGTGCKIYPFIENISSYILGADVIIARAGAMTLSEISRAGVPAILIPSPNVTDNHQYKNAKLFSDAGAAILIEESELSEAELLNAVRYLEENASERRKMAANIASFYRSDSRDLIYGEISHFTP